MPKASSPTMDPLATVMLLSLAAVWGGSFFFAEVALREVPPLTIVLHRVFWAAPILALIVALKGIAIPTSTRVWGGYLVMGALNNAIPFSLIFWGQTQIDSGLDYYPLPGRGERFPVCDPDLGPRIGPRPVDDAAFLHGLLEGMARIEALGYSRLAELGAPYPDVVYSSGGGAANAAWRQIRQRCLGVPVELAAHAEAAYGTALLARAARTAD